MTFLYPCQQTSEEKAHKCSLTFYCQKTKQDWKKPSKYAKITSQENKPRERRQFLP
jgi:hypothetical protein